MQIRPQATIFEGSILFGLLFNEYLILPINLYIPLVVWCRGNDEIDLSSFASNVLKNIFGELVKI